MIVQCEQCGTKYKFDDSKIGIQGITVKCSRCNNVFKVFHPLSLDEEAIFGVRMDTMERPAPKESLIKPTPKESITKPAPRESLAKPATKGSIESSSLEAWEEEFAKELIPRKDTAPVIEEAPPPRAFVPPPPDEVPLRKEEETEELPHLEEEFSPIKAPAHRTIPPKKERKVSRTFLLSILLLALVFAAAYYWKQEGQSIPQFESIYEKISNIMGVKNTQKLFLIYLKGSEHKLEGGKVFVIQGKVANRSQETKRLVKLKGVLLSKDGKTLATNVGYCGRTLSDEEIKKTTYDSLKLSFGFASPGQASPVEPEQSIPFTIIFFSPPEGAAEYQVVIDEETKKK